MNRRTWRTLLLLIVGSTIAVLLAACADDPTPTPTSSPPTPTATPTDTTTPPSPTATPTPAPSPTATPTPEPPPECDAEQFGQVTRCNNFYSDFWPIVEQSIDDLYDAAVAAGELNHEYRVWGFGELSDAEKKGISDRFPGVRVSSRGLRFGAAAALIEAERAGTENSAEYFGSLTTFWPAWTAGVMDTTVDWTQYGVPRELLASDIMPGQIIHSQQSYGLFYNTNEVDPADLPTNPFDFLDPRWKGEIVTDAVSLFGGFSYIALKFSEEEAVDLLNRLFDEQGIAVVDQPDTLLTSGERTIYFPASGTPPSLYRGAPIAAAPYQGMGIFQIVGGVVKDTPTPNLAKARTLYEIFDPDYKQFRTESPDFANPALHPGLPLEIVDPLDLIGQQALRDGIAVLFTEDLIERRADLVSVMQGIVFRR